MLLFCSLPKVSFLFAFPFLSFYCLNPSHEYMQYFIYLFFFCICSEAMIIEKMLIIAFHIEPVQQRIRVMGIKCIKDEDIF